MQNLIALFIVLAAIGHAHAEEEWVQAPKSLGLPGQNIAGKTFFSPIFGKKSGAFRVTYESALDNRDSVSGNFLVGKFRYTYQSAIGEGGIVPKHDESISVVLLDCKESLSGTLSETYLLKGKVVRTTIYKDNDVSFIQYFGSSTVGNLCAFAKKRGAL